MIKRICDLCTNDGEICHIARYKDADGDVVTIEAMLRPNYRGVVEWIYSQWQVVLHCVNAAKGGISDGMNQGGVIYFTPVSPFLVLLLHVFLVSFSFL